MHEEQAADELCVIELSRRTGSTVGALRDHHSRRLWQPPVMRGRTG